MRYIILGVIIAFAMSMTFIFIAHAKKHAPEGCFVGAFLSDDTTAKDISQFREDYGKKPYIVMLFIEWNVFVKARTIKDVYGEGSVLMVTWEPWTSIDKKGIDFDRLLAGGYDGYIKEFASRLKDVKKDVYMRFAHESNGDWYPWSAAKLGNEKYIAVYRHVKDIFYAVGASNVKWVFSVNWEDIPESNDFVSSYPGDTYVDYMGIDGYNWGTTKSWSNWKSFSEIFSKRYDAIAAKYKQPIIISEFSSSSVGGDKRLWIEDAMQSLKALRRVAAFVIFNVDKETDWSLPIGTSAGKEFKKQLENSYFREF